MERMWSTREAARVLGISPVKLSRELWLGRVTAPQKSPAGDYLWGAREIEGACLALHLNLREVLAQISTDGGKTP